MACSQLVTTCPCERLKARQGINHQRQIDNYAALKNARDNLERRSSNYAAFPNTRPVTEASIAHCQAQLDAALAREPELERVAGRNQSGPAELAINRPRS